MTKHGKMDRMLDESEIVLAYQLLLGRTPSDAEVARMLDRGPQLDRLRRVFLSSREFSRTLTQLLPNHSVQIHPCIDPTHAARLLHLHIPKTAGTTMSAVLAGAMKPGQSVTVSENGLGLLGGRDPEELATFRFIFGHLSYKVMAYFPPDTLAICVLRRPGDRLLSFYRYVRRTRDHALYAVLAPDDLSFGEFLEFVDADPRHRVRSDNLQMRIISGLTEEAWLDREREVFETAMSHVVTGKVMFGLTERLDSFQAYLKSVGILQDISTARLNASDTPAVLDVALADLTPKQREIFDRYTEWDDLLYATCDKITQDREVSPLHKSGIPGVISV